MSLCYYTSALEVNCLWLAFGTGMLSSAGLPVACIFEKRFLMTKTISGKATMTVT